MDMRPISELLCARRHRGIGWTSIALHFLCQLPVEGAGELPFLQLCLARRPQAVFPLQGLQQDVLQPTAVTGKHLKVSSFRLKDSY